MISRGEECRSRSAPFAYLWAWVWGDDQDKLAGFLYRRQSTTTGQLSPVDSRPFEPIRKVGSSHSPTEHTANWRGRGKETWKDGRVPEWDLSLANISLLISENTNQEQCSRLPARRPSQHETLCSNVEPAGWRMIRCDHAGSGCAAGFYLLRRGSAYYILSVLSSTPNVKVHQGSVELQIQLWVVSVQKDCVTSARDTYPANPVWVESAVHGGWVSWRRSLPLGGEGGVFDLLQVPGGDATFFSGPTRDLLNEKKMHRYNKVVGLRSDKLNYSARWSM